MSNKKINISKKEKLKLITSLMLEGKEVSSINVPIVARVYEEEPDKKKVLVKLERTPNIDYIKTEVCRGMIVRREKGKLDKLIKEERVVEKLESILRHIEYKDRNKDEIKRKLSILRARNKLDNRNVELKVSEIKEESKGIQIKLNLTIQSYEYEGEQKSKRKELIKAKLQGVEITEKGMISIDAAYKYFYNIETKVLSIPSYVEGIEYERAGQSKSKRIRDNKKPAIKKLKVELLEEGKVGIRKSILMLRVLESTLNMNKINELDLNQLTLTLNKRIVEDLMKQIRPLSLLEIELSNIRMSRKDIKDVLKRERDIILISETKTESKSKKHILTRRKEINTPDILKKRLVLKVGQDYYYILEYESVCIC